MKNSFKVFSFIFMLFVSLAVTAQHTIKGVIVDASDQTPLLGANVIETGTNNGTTTDFNGAFNLKVNGQSGTIAVSYVGYETVTIPYSNKTDLGVISLGADNTLESVVIVGSGVVDLAEGRETPVAVSTIGGQTIQLKVAGNVEFGESIKNTPSVYVSNQASGFGDSQIFLRGFDQTNTAYLLNGQPINGMEDGKMYWSNWSGMSDVANAIQVQRGLGASKLAISSVGGTVNIVSKTTEKRAGGFVRFLTGNDSYFKTTASYNSGLKDSGWAYSILLDHWQAHRKYAVGTAGQGQSYLFSVGYKPNENHAFNFLLTGSPQWHDQNYAQQSRDFYKTYGEKANRNTGLLDGERFTERRNFYHKPVINLNWDFDIKEGLDLSTVLYASWGRGGGTGGAGRGRVRNSDTGSAYEINFEQIRKNNMTNTAKTDGIGNFNNSYVRRASVNSHNWYGVLSNLDIEVIENWAFNVGIDARTYKGIHFKQLANKLGLNGYVDTSRTNRAADYAITETFEANPWSALFNHAGQGQRFDYNYQENIKYLGGFAQAEYKTDHFSAFLQAALSTQSFQREGFFVGNGNGLGKSKKISRMGHNIKAGLAYKLNEEHAVFVNSGRYSRQPFLDNIFSNIRYDNEITSPEVDNEKINSLEGGYRFKNHDFRLNIDLYTTKWSNRFLSINGPDQAGPDGTLDTSDDQQSTYRLKDLTQVHKGIELDFEYLGLTPSLTLKGYASFGDWSYQGSTPYDLQNDDTGVFVVEDTTVELDGIKISNAPQTSFGLGVKAMITEGLFVDVDYNTYAKLYGFADPGDIVVARIAGETYTPEKLSSYSLFDAGLTYKFSLGSNKMTFRTNVLNLFNTPYTSQKTAFGYYLGVGRTWNMSMRYNF